MNTVTTSRRVYVSPAGGYREAANDEPEWTREKVRALVAAKWPEAMQSPLYDAMHAASALLQLEASDADAVAMRGDAMEHARACLRSRSGWTVETLSHNIESAFDMDSDWCDDIARNAIKEQSHE